MEEQIKIIEKEVESLKITRNTKGYNWEFRLVGKVEEQIERSKIINDKLESIYTHEKVGDEI